MSKGRAAGCGGSRQVTDVGAAPGALPMTWGSGSRELTAEEDRAGKPDDAKNVREDVHRSYLPRGVSGRKLGSAVSCRRQNGMTRERGTG
jgi:hypothetical protein